MTLTPLETSFLDDAIGAALETRHFSLAITHGSARRYPDDVAPFASIGPSPSPSPAGWDALSHIVAPGTVVAMSVAPPSAVSDSWRVVDELALTQLTDDHADEFLGTPPESHTLTNADVPEMMRLTRLARPGPFETRTITFGGYRGIFSDDGRLVSMAGRRLSVPGWTEVSAVCTDPAARGRGYARHVVLDVVRDIHAEGDRAFLYVAEGNPARRLYESLGFVARSHYTVYFVERRTP